MTFLARFSACLALGFMATLTQAQAQAQAAGVRAFPMTGTDIPALRGVDRVVSNFMATYQIPGGSLGVVKDGRLVFVRGYGMASRATGEPVEPDSLFRLASLSKPITAAAILRLVQEGRLSLSQPAFALIHEFAPTYPGAQVDPRLYRITVEQLLHHTGGWNRETARDPVGNAGFDPTVQWTVEAAREMGVRPPADAETMVHWMMGKPLQFDPGTEYHYSNFGYTVLGRIIERITGQTYAAAVRDLFRGLGITRLHVSGSRIQERLPGEVIYYDDPETPRVPSIFPEDAGPVALPYAFDFETMDSHGGWAASAVDLLRFVTAVDGRTAPGKFLRPETIAHLVRRPWPPWGPGEESFYGMGWMIRENPGNWWHTGSLPGTATEMVRAGNGFSWVALFHLRSTRTGNRFFNDLDRLGWLALEAVAPDAWPDHDLFDAMLSREAWTERHFTAAELELQSVSGDTADPDQDGRPNLLEYAVGSHPRRADLDKPVQGRLRGPGNAATACLTFRRRLLGKEVDYRGEVSEDLVQWKGISDVADGAGLDSDGFQSVTWSVPPAPGGGTRYLRLVVARHEQASLTPLTRAIPRE